MIRKIHFLLIAFNVLSASIFSQDSKVDSLKNQIKIIKEDSLLINIYNKICEEYLSTIPDSALHYAEKGKQIAVQINDKKNIANFLKQIANAYFKKDDYAKSLEFYQKALAEYEKLDSENKESKKGIADCYSNIGVIHYFNSELPIALDYYSKALEIYKQLNNIQWIAYSYNRIGAVYRKNKDYVKALEYYNNSLLMFKELSHSLNSEDSKKGKKGMADSYSCLAITYYYLNQKAQVLENFQKSLLVYEEMNDYYNISLTQSNIAEFLIKSKKYNEALKYALQSVETAKKNNAFDNLRSSYHILSSIYDSLGSYGNAYKLHKLFSEYTDSLFNQEKSRQMAQMEAIYQNEKKQNEIELLNKDKALQNEEIKKQAIIKNSFIIGFGLILLVAIIIYRSFRQKRKANIILFRQKTEIEQQKEEIQSQSELLINTNLELQAKNTQIIDSINYAKLIQQAILPNISSKPQEEESSKLQTPSSKSQEEESNQYSVNSNQSAVGNSQSTIIDSQFATSTSNFKLQTSNSFVFFRPRDIVSGDFYWLQEKNNSIYFAIADCTGHGVPGAFMSMIGNTLLNEIVAENSDYSPSIILDKLNEKVKYSLNQSAESNAKGDGMDISLCKIEKKQKTLQIACAKQTVYIFSKENEMIEINGDSYSIGAFFKNRDNINFTNHTINIESINALYLTSDGITDQFGGENYKKFGSERFKNLLHEIQSMPMEGQLKIIDDKFTSWKGIKNQTDDVVVLGIKF